jgi:outer membrane autotransporter protein
LIQKFRLTRAAGRPVDAQQPGKGNMTNDNRRMLDGAPRGGHTGEMTVRTSRRALSWSAAIAALLVSTALTAPARAASINWSGSAGTDWFTAGNWAGGAVPGAGANVAIDNTNPAWIDGNPASAVGVNVGVTNASPGATLTIQNGGALTASYGVGIGNTAGAQGTLTVTGPGSSLTAGDSGSSSGVLYAGIGGTGSFVVSDGAHATVYGNSYVGYATGAVGTAAISGSGSEWTTGNLAIGFGGTQGQLTISDNAVVNASSVTLAGSSSALNIGAASGATAAAPGTLTAPGIVFNGDATTAVVFNHTATDYVFGAAMSGTVGAIKVEHGTTILTGANTYTGTTTISSGAMLQIGNGGATGSFAGAITDNGTLAFNRSDDLTHSGTISGSGALTKLGAGNLTLTGTKSYTGGTTISAGTLTGSTSSFGTGAILNNAALVFDQATTATFSQAITGTGTLTKTGAGNLTLSGANTYTGGTTISAGWLTGTAASLGDGDILNNAGLTFNQATDGTFSHAITGTGSVYKAGTGNLTLTGTSSYDSTTTVSAGALTVSGASGAVTTSKLNVSGASGATLALQGGGKLTTTGTSNDSVWVGYNSGYSGTVTVSGDGSRLTSGGDLKLGLAGSGSMAVSDGGAVSVVGTLFLAQGALASAGSLTVAGDGSSVSVGGGLLIGATGSGAMTVSDGGAVSVAGYLSMGAYNSTASGFLTITGDGSSVTAGTGATVGSGGTGSLTVSDGGQFLVTNGGVGAGAGGNTHGDIVITGAGSLMQASFVQIGYVSTVASTMTVSAGGGVETQLGMIGVLAGGAGTVTVTGAGSRWTNSADFYFGAGGAATGTLTIADGGTVSTGSGVSYTLGASSKVSTSTVYLAYSAGSVATLNIGAASGSAAAAAGTLDSEHVVFGPGTGTVVFNHTGTDYVFGAAMSGTAGTIKVESGTTILTGASTYTGATTISSGATLQIGNGGTTGSFAGAITDNGALVFNRSNDLTHGGAISGSGTLTKLGAGNVTLAGVNTYAGGTTISAGTLTGTVDSFGTGAIAVAGGAFLGLAQDTDATFAKTVSGAGSVIKTGTGNLTLGNNNTYAGGTTISAGTLSGSAASFGTGGINVDSVANLMLVQATDASLANVISGAGTISKSGTGNLTLTGDSSGFSGTTYVTEGTLSVNGTLGDSSSTVSVIGGTLGGSGTIGGSVTITGGTLAPGNSPGTLTINGDLTLASASTLNYELGEAGAIGGDYNDHTIVHGNLTLDGTLNVSQSAGGTYGAGVYRLISYDGTLTDNGLELGTMPSGSSNSVQTSVTGQVNLINTQGLELRFWDGDAGPKNNGVINGGSGTWTVAASGAHNDNWTTSDGALNAPFTNGAYAVFQGTAGTVTVDNTAGQVQVSGMQFAVDGYTVTGGAIELLSGSNDVRVGDGTSDGAAMTATIASVLKGSGKLNKTDLGTLVLTGVNTYSGGTTISAGTLTGSATSFGTGDIENNAALVLDQASSATLSNAISGSGTVTKTGAGNLTLAGDNTYSGGTTISAGTLTGSATSFGTGNIVNNAALVFAQTTDDTFGSTISGSGTLTKTGTGKLTLMGENSYEGGTTISAGTLSGSAVSFGTGNIVNNAALELAQVSDGTLANVISGSGSVTKILAGNLTLSGNNSYEGGTTISAGTLTGSATSFGTGNIVNNAALVFDQATTAAFGGTISGSGTLTKTGDGELTLSALGGNTYSGGTTISGGVLKGSANSFGSGGIAIAAGATLGLSQATDATLANAISGAGGVDKFGAGNLTLSGNNTYSGVTYIGAGTLTGSATSFGTGAILNNAALVLDQETDDTLANAISGTGTVTKMGAGNLTLTGDNGYSGGTTITAGTLTGSASSFGTGAIVNNAALVFAQADDATFSQVISGTGTLTKSGAGTLNLTGDSSSFTGATTIAEGGLKVNGSLAASIVTVQSGAVLSGAGTVGGVVAASGSTVSPGNSPGTLTVTGNYLQQTGSTYLVEVVPGGTTSDLIAVTGSATIADGAILSVSKYGSGSFVLNARYTVLTATEGVSGTYTLAGNTTVSAFYSLVLDMEPTAAYLEVQQTHSFTEVAQTPNQIATAGGLQSLPTGNVLRDAISSLQTGAQARAAFDSLSGEIHASAKTAMIEDSRFIRNAVNDRIRAAFDSVGASGAVTTYVDGRPVAVKASTDRFAVWGHGFGSWGHVDGDGNAARLSRSIGGFFIGADAPVFDTWRFGAVAGYSHTNFDVKDRHSSGVSDNYHVGLYGGTAWGSVSFRMGAAYAWHDISTSRRVMFSGFSDSLKGDYDASTAQVFGELAYAFDAGGARFEPFANLAYVNLHTDGFTERGGAAALASPSADTDATFTTLGLRAATTFDMSGGTVTTKGMLGWRHAFSDVTPETVMRFVSGGNAFIIAGVPIVRDAAVVEAGLDFAVTTAATLGIAYGGQFGTDMTDQSLKANLNVRF